MLGSSSDNFREEEGRGATTGPSSFNLRSHIFTPQCFFNTEELLEQDKRSSRLLRRIVDDYFYPKPLALFLDSIRTKP
jgi:hypothetical protein